MSTINQSTPRAILYGVKDESTRQLSVVPVNLPVHLPWFFTFAEKGPNTPILTLGGNAVKVFGSDTFNTSSIYATHQTNFINAAFAGNNPCFIQRLIPEGAKKAILRLSLELIPAELPLYERNADGSIKYTIDAYDQRIKVIDQSKTVDGYRVVIHTTLEPYAGKMAKPLKDLSGDDLFGVSEPVQNYRQGSTPANQGTLTLGKAGESSTLYPILDLLVNDPGGYGNRLGVRFQLPYATSLYGLDINSVYSNLSYLLRVGLVEKSNFGESTTQLETAGGDMFLDVSFKSGAKTDRTEISLDLEERIISSYGVYDDDDESISHAPPFGKVHVYRENIEAIVKKLVEKETPYNAMRKGFGSLEVDENNPYLVNFLGGFDELGIPYYSFDVSNSAAFDGVAFGTDSVIYAQLGDDGLPRTKAGEVDVLGTYELFDTMVRQLMEKINETQLIQIRNYAKYPISAIWDSGFSINTKKAMCNILAHRKDVGVVLGTYAIADWITVLENSKPVKKFTWAKKLKPEEEISVGAMLKTHCALFPESEIYNTKVCRAVIIGYSGNILNSNYTKAVPLTYDYFTKVVAYMGSPSGVWDGDKAYDLPNNNIVNTMGKISITWLNQNLANKAWSNGIVYVEDFDTKRLFYPGIRTVYNEETSVLNSTITMWAICFIERVCHKNWRDLTGNSKWNPDKFLEESNRLIAQDLSNVFDDRFVIIPETTFTASDVERGYSWTTTVHIYASNMKTVGKYTVVSQRLEDYKAANGTN